MKNIRFILELSIPANSSATINVPATPDSSILESGQAAEISQGVVFKEMNKRRAVYSICPGDYCFESALIRKNNTTPNNS